jgi:hypothetical protein
MSLEDYAAEAYDDAERHGKVDEFLGIHPGSASPSSERPAEPPDDHADFLATQAGGFAAAKAFAENRRVSQPSPGGSGGETTLTPNDPHGANIEWQYDPKWGLQWRGEWATGCHQPYFTTGLEKWVMTRERIALAARLSGDAAPQACEACDGSGWGYNADGSEGAPCAACRGSGISASAPRPQEGEAAALTRGDEAAEIRLAYLLSWIETETRTVVPFPLSDLRLLVRLASPLPPRDERPSLDEGPTRAQLTALRKAAWEASLAWETCECFANDCPHEAAYFAARDAFLAATFRASPRPGAEATTNNEDIMDETTRELDDCIETAWGIIANASGGTWERESPDWVEAASRWRDKWVGQMSARAAARSSSVSPASESPAARPVRSEEPTDG